MKIERIELREIQMPLVHFFETSFGRVTTRRLFLIKVVEDGLEGWGESTAHEGPFYNEETIDSAWLMVEQHIAPLLLGKDLAGPHEVTERLAKLRGNRMAKAGVEIACWDLEARRQGEPLWKLIGGTRSEIECGVSIGIQETIEDLLDQIEKELSRGYRRIKIKIKPGWDADVVRKVRARFPEIRLMVDANSAFSLADTDRLRQLDEFNLMMIEQPLSHDDIIDHATLQRAIKTPVCLDESIHHADDARKARALGACKIINVKLGRVGGHLQVRRLHDFCAANQLPVWCGGMLETGIGRAHNIALSTLPGFVLPGDISASERYWEEDIIDPPVIVSPQGTITAPTKPGIGFDVKTKRIESLTVRRQLLRS